MNPDPTFPNETELITLSNTRGISGLPFMAIGQTPGYPRRLAKEWFIDRMIQALCALRVYKSATDGALQCSVLSGTFYNGKTAVTYAGVTGQDLTNNATNYIYLTAAGALTVNTTGFPATSHLPLATIVTVGGVYNSDPAAGAIVDCRPLFNLPLLAAAAAATLTGGASSNADALHVHALPTIPNGTITAAMFSTAIAALVGGASSNADALHAHSIANGTITAAMLHTAIAALVGGASSNADSLHVHTIANGTITAAMFSTAIAALVGGASSNADSLHVHTIANGTITAAMLHTAIAALVGGASSNADALHTHATSVVGDNSITVAKLADAVKALMPKIAFVPANHHDGTGAVAIVVQNANSASLSGVFKMRVWTSATDKGAKAAIATLTVPSAGFILHEYTANQYIEVVTNSSGQCSIDINVGGASTGWVMAEMDGIIYSVQLAITTS